MAAETTPYLPGPCAICGLDLRYVVPVATPPDGEPEPQPHLGPECYRLGYAREKARAERLQALVDVLVGGISECESEGGCRGTKFVPVESRGSPSLIQHTFEPNPWGKDLCDRKYDQGDGRPRQCARPRKEHVE